MKSSTNKKCVLTILILFSGVLFAQAQAKSTQADIQKVRNFIKKNWAGTIEYNPVDKGNLLGLPKPYNVPTVHGENMFREMYYWDTYFTNLGLLNDNEIEQAKNNVDDILYMINRFGKMLNGSNTCYLNRSQPPYASMMVADIFDKTNDKAWLKQAVATLEKEYKFWMIERITASGLNRYSSAASNDEKRWMADFLKSRFGKSDFLKGKSGKEILTIGSHYTAEAESGWDFNPRFLGRCEDFNPIDLNSNLYIYETNFAKFYKILGEKQKIAQWKKAATKRKELINKYCYNKQSKTFFDYDFVNKKQSTVISSAIFSVLFAKIATQEQAKNTRYVLPKLETNFGLRAVADQNYELNYQWGISNGWAPLHALAVKGFRNYKMTVDANRIQQKFITLVVANFNKTGNLWEKYNVIDGTTNTTNEYEMPKFLGWTAGVFVYFTN